MLILHKALQSLLLQQEILCLPYFFPLKNDPPCFMFIEMVQIPRSLPVSFAGTSRVIKLCIDYIANKLFLQHTLIKHPANQIYGAFFICIK